MTMNMVWNSLRRGGVRGLRMMTRDRSSALLLTAGIGVSLWLAGLSFVLMDAFVISPVAVERSDELRMIWGRYEKRPDSRTQLRGEVARHLAGVTDSGTQVAVLASESGRVRAGSVTIEFNGTRATPNALQVLRPRFDPTCNGAAFGRPSAAAGGSAVVSWAAAQALFGSGVGACGKELSIGDRPAIVVGVLSPRVRWSHFGDPQFWLATALEEFVDRTGVQLLARAQAADIPSLESRVQSLLAASYQPPPDLGAISPWIEPFDEWLLRDAPNRASVMAAMLVLTVLCLLINVAGMWSARSATLGPDRSLRRQIGASNGALWWEDFGLALVSVVPAVALALAALVPSVRYLQSVGPDTMIGLDLVRFEPVTVAFVSGVGVLMTALLSLSAFVGANLALDPRAPQGVGFVRHGLLALQVCAVVVLSAVGVTVLEDLREISSPALGFDHASVATVRVDAKAASVDGPRGFWPASVRMAEAVKMVTGSEVALAGAVPLRGFGSGLEVVADAGEAMAAEARYVSHGYFSVFSIPVLEGVWPSDADLAQRPGIIAIDATLARSLWPEGGAVGQTVVLRAFRSESPVQIVAVVQNAISAGYGRDIVSKPAVYRPLPAIAFSSPILAFRPTGDRGALTLAIRDELQRVAPSMTLGRAEPQFLSDLIDDQLESPRWHASASSALATSAVFMLLLGALATGQLLLRQRRKELAIRSALGGPVTRIVWSLAARPAMAVVLGAVIGVLVYRVVTQVVQPYLPVQLESSWPAIYSAIGVFFLTWIALVLPLGAAVRQNPSDLLRER